MPNDSAIFNHQAHTPVEHPKSVLCVDADDESRLLVAELLYEYEVDFALTGDDAVQLAHSRSYALYVVDPEVPGCEGVDLLNDLRLYDRETPLVLLTNAETPPPSARPAAACVRKPLCPAGLRETLTQIMRGDDDARPARPRGPLR